MTHGRVGLASAVFACLLSASWGQDVAPTADEVTAEATGGEDSSRTDVDVAERVQVEPQTEDATIARRLREIFTATGWFTDLDVDARSGVIFLSGVADTQKHQRWAEATAMNTTDVVAVVNRIDIADRPLWDLAPAWQSIKQLTRETLNLLPLILVAMLIALAAYYLSKLTGRLAKSLTKSRIDSALLRQVAGNAIAVLVFIIGVYVALRVSGLTRLAVTLLGGTGLVGLALGFAFRDIAENYLASILISLNHPFRVGDLIMVDDAKGFVGKVTTRGTILNTLQGNQIQIPNATVYKSKVTNFTSTPLLRLEFAVGVGFEDSVSEAQEVIMDVCQQHSAVKDDPAPQVLVESLGSATVNLRCLYWIDQHRHSGLKVGSSVIRLAKEALTDRGISMPDEARELVFPQGVPVKMLESGSPAPSSPPAGAKRESPIAQGEGDLSNEQADVMRVTHRNHLSDDQPNLIE